MAHIADFMVETTSMAGLNNHIARGLSPNSPHEASLQTSTATPADEKKTFVWRMHQPTESRKYQLFPAKEKLSISAGRKSPDSETLLSSAMGRAEKDRSMLGSVIRPKAKEPAVIRRRKVSVPELGPMTTVQEVPMDSPTIPGRPPLHERSISAPGNSWRQHVFGESMLSCISGPALDENLEIAISDSIPSASQASDNYNHVIVVEEASNSPRKPLSPKTLAPLVIPSTSASQPQRLRREASSTRLRSGSTPPDVPPKSARMMEGSPYSKASPFTPISASTTSLPMPNAPFSANNTPNSAPEGRSSPKPWSAGPSPNPASMGHSRGQSETIHRLGHVMSHRRGESDASIMDRGRPKKRSDGSPIKRIPSKRAASLEEVKAFETLPQGYRAADASTSLLGSEIDILRKQALGQASRFEVLGPKDVEALSRELRGLDERCEYLRKTHRSLRAGRRNLHDRICTYLRSPRIARFSHEAMLKQEEALSELDSSIDDWVAKLEQAENRRTRVRQKLLEHVAAALILQPTWNNIEKKADAPSGVSTPPRSPTKSQSPQRLAPPVQPSEDVVKRTVPSTTGENTPPRSPTKTQSLQQIAKPVQVNRPEQMDRQSVESIRIYADLDIFALLADVEDEINRMGDQAEAQKDISHEAAINAGVMLHAVTFTPPPKSVGRNNNKS